MYKRYGTSFLIFVVAYSLCLQNVEAQQNNTPEAPFLTDLIPTTTGQLSINEYRDETHTRTRRIPETVIRNGMNVTIYRDIQETYTVRVAVPTILNPLQTKFYHARGDEVDYGSVARLLSVPTPVVVADKLPQRAWLQILQPNTLIVVRGNGQNIGTPPLPPNMIPPVPLTTTYELRVPGTPIASRAVVTPRFLKITNQGQTTTYKRNAAFDKQGYTGYFSRSAKQGIGWPTSNRGNLIIATEDILGDIRHRESQMEIVPQKVPNKPVGRMDGMYRIQAIGNGLFLHDDGQNDRLLSTRYQATGDYTRFKLESQSDGSYAIRVKASGRVWYLNEPGDSLVTTGQRTDMQQTHFNFVQRSPGVYQIVSAVSGKHLHLDGLQGGDQLLSTRHQTNDNFTLFKLVPEAAP